MLAVALVQHLLEDAHARLHEQSERENSNASEPNHHGLVRITAVILKAEA